MKRPYSILEVCLLGLFFKCLDLFSIRAIFRNMLIFGLIIDGGLYRQELDFPWMEIESLAHAKNIYWEYYLNIDFWIGFKDILVILQSIQLTFLFDFLYFYTSCWSSGGLNQVHWITCFILLTYCRCNFKAQNTGWLEYVITRQTISDLDIALPLFQCYNCFINMVSKTFKQTRFKYIFNAKSPSWLEYIFFMIQNYLTLSNFLSYCVRRIVLNIVTHILDIAEKRSALIYKIIYS